MSATTGQPAAAASAATERARRLSAGELAWVAAIPCALIVLVAALLLGPPLGHALFPHGSDALWPPSWWEATGRAEPTKHARYLIATLAPLLLAGAILLGLRRRWALHPGATRALALASQVALVAVVAFGLLGQQGTIAFGSLTHPPRAIFGIPTLAAAAAILPATLLALRDERLGARIARIVRETAARRRIGFAVAALVSAAWLLEAVMSDGMVEDKGVFNWTLNDAFALLDGRTPLVDYHLLYGKLMPYPAAAVLAVFGTSGLVYTLFLTLLSVLALVAVYAILRPIAGSSLLALVLFLPFVALSAAKDIVIQAGLWPMRYAFAYLVAWLTARHLEGRRPRRAWIVFLVGGLGAVNSMEFGLGALLGSALAIVCVQPPRAARAWLRLAGEATAGVAGSIAIVSAATLAGSGRLPDPALLMEWPRIFTSLGWFALPVPVASLHLAVFATFAAAIVVAIVRSLGGERDTLTGMLAWSGVLGLMAGSYYVGRAEDVKLIALFSAWGFSLVLLTVACARALAARGWRRPAIAELLVLFGFAVAVCAFVQVPSPIAPLQRLRSAPPLQYRPAAEAFVRERTRPGEKVAILLPEGDRIAYDLGLDDVSPYGFVNAIVTRREMQTLIDTVRREDVRAIFLPAPTAAVAGEGNSAPEQIQLLESIGYRTGATTTEGFLELAAGG